MSTYNNTFGGNFIQPSTVSYKNIILNSNVELTWPTTYEDTSGDYVLASYMTVQASQNVETIFDLGNDPIETTDGSSVVKVTIESTEKLFVGTQININGSTDVNGISADELNIRANILEITGGNSFTYTSNGTANADGDGGGEDIVLTYNIPFSINLPDATKVSIGTPLNFINNGENPFFVSDNQKNFLVTLDVGNVYQLLLTDNSTSAGIWQILEAGTGTASSNAYQLTGLGLKVLNGTLNTNFPSKIIQGDYTSTAADRSSLIVWAGGVGNIELFPDAPIGFPESINNSGQGVIKVLTSDGSTIDGKESIVLNPGESSQFIKTLSGSWNSLGLGKETFLGVDVLSKNIAPGGNVILTNDEASNLIQIYTGALLQDAIVNFPAVTGQWYVSNNTTNNLTVTLKLFSVEGGFIIPQGEKLIVYSDGQNLYSTPTTATNAIFNPGNEGSPTIIFTNDATTGFYSAGVGDFGFSSGGNLSLDLANYGLGIKGGLESRYYNLVNSFYAALKAGNMTSNITWTLPISDATNSGQIIYSNATASLAFTTAVYPTTTTINQLLYSSAANVITGLATANNGVLITSATGVPSIGTATVPVGGTGSTTFTAYSPICAGTTDTGNFQSAGTGETGQYFVSNGNGAIAGWQTGVRRINQVKTDNYTVLATDNGSNFTCNSAVNFTITLTTAGTLGAGFLCSFMNINDNIVTISTSGGQTIDGASTSNLLYPGQSITLFTDGTNFFSNNKQGYPSYQKRQIFTANGNFTVPVGVTAIYVECYGGGGSGGGNNTGHGSNGGGGGGGGYCDAIQQVIPGAIIPVIVGVGGTGTTGTGTAGGNSTFNGLSANGGQGGITAGENTVLGGSGGTANGGDINLNGESGDVGAWFVNSGTALNLQGRGGKCRGRYGGGSSSQTLTNGVSGMLYGGGGGGGGPSPGTYIGGNGGNGAVIIWW